MPTKPLCGHDRQYLFLSDNFWIPGGLRKNITIEKRKYASRNRVEKCATSNEILRASYPGTVCLRISISPFPGTIALMTCSPGGRSKKQ